GTARALLEQAASRGKDLLLDIDVQGARQVRERVPEAVSIFILPPNPQVLEGRLRERSRSEGALDPSIIRRRLDKARHEIENYSQYSYILVNDVLEVAVAQLLAIVTVERQLRSHEPGEPEDLERYEAMARNCRQFAARPALAPVLASFGLGS
ncbi:MAG TPA: guanylate kinase, partial [Acidobacteriaceae bacterium]